MCKHKTLVWKSSIQHFGIAFVCCWINVSSLSQLYYVKSTYNNNVYTALGMKMI